MSYFLSRLSGTTKVAALTSRQVSNVVDTHESNGGYVPGFGAARRHHGGWDLASPGSVQGTWASGGTGHERSGVLAGGSVRRHICSPRRRRSGRPGEARGASGETPCPNGQCLPVPQARDLQQVANKYLLVD